MITTYTPLYTRFSTSDARPGPVQSIPRSSMRASATPRPMMWMGHESVGTATLSTHSLRPQMVVTSHPSRWPIRWARRPESGAILITASGQSGASRAVEVGVMPNESPRRDRSQGPSSLVGYGTMPSSAASPWMNSNRMGVILTVEPPLILLTAPVVYMLMSFILGRLLRYPMYQA